MFHKLNKGPILAKSKEIGTYLKQHGESAIPTDLRTAVVAGIESFDEAKREGLADGVASLRQGLLQSGLREVLVAKLGKDVSEDDPRFENAVNAAVMVAAASTNPTEFVSKYAKPADADGIVLGGTEAFGDDVIAGLENFDKQSFDKFVGYNVVLAALSAGSSEFEEAIFPTEVLAAGVSGAEIHVTQPYAYRSIKRTNGQPARLEKRKLVDAIRDASLLATDVTRIFPHAIAGNAAYLADVAVVPTVTKTVDGVAFDSRPIKFGVDVDLLGVSAVPGLVSGTQDETDTLHPAISLGEVFLTVTDTAATPNKKTFMVDVGNAQGALFQRPQTGKGNDLILNFSGNVTVTEADLGTDVSATLKTAGNITDTMEIVARLDVTGNANSQNANIRLNFGGLTVVEVYSVSATGVRTQVSSADKAAVAAAFTTAPAGCFPAARRSNANMRQQGLLINSGETVKYVLPNYPQSPLSSNAPLNVEGYAMTIEGLAQAQSVRQHNNAVNALLEIADVVKSNSGLGNTGLMAGAEYITPRYVDGDVLDLSSMAITLNSMEAMRNVSATLVNAATIIVQRMVRESGYLAALQVMGAENDYEVVIATDSQIKGLLKIDGDQRTLGNGVSFRAVSTEDARMAGKMFFILRRKSEKLHPMSFGARVMTPALISEIQNNRGDSVRKELMLVPRDQIHGVCPVMGALTVNGLQNIFVDAQIQIRG